MLMLQGPNPGHGFRYCAHQWFVTSVGGRSRKHSAAATRKIAMHGDAAPGKKSWIFSTAQVHIGISMYQVESI